MMAISRILIVRTDSIGDVMLTLPMAYYIKQLFPQSTVFFLGKSYTQDVVSRCLWVDEFLNADEAVDDGTASNWMRSLHLDAVIFALTNASWMKACAAAQIKIRVATGHRFSSWRWATHRPMFGRKNSNLHEAQLNLKLLSVFGFKNLPSLQELNQLDLLSFSVTQKRRRLIIHPFSQGSALNWTLDQYDELVGLLKGEDWEMVVSGTVKDKVLLAAFRGEHLNTIPSICGELTLDSFIDYIAESEMLLACSTGPLHLAAAAGIHAIGLYVDRRPIHPGRWSPIGPHVHLIEEKDEGQNRILTKPNEVATFLKTIMERPTTMH